MAKAIIEVQRVGSGRHRVAILLPGQRVGTVARGEPIALPRAIKQAYAVAAQTVRSKRAASASVYIDGQERAIFRRGR